MTAKEYLKQYEQARKREIRFKAEYDKECEMIDAIKSALDTDGLPHGNRISRITEDKALQLLDKAAKWKMAQIDALQLRQEVFEVISKVPDPEGEILYERYINLRRWEDVCVLVHMSWRTTHRTHAKGLAMVANIIGIE